MEDNSFSDFGCFTKIILYLTMFETYLYLHLVKHSFLFSKVHNSGTFGRGRFEIISERVPFETSKPSNKTFLIIYLCWNTALSLWFAGATFAPHHEGPAQRCH